MTSTVHASQAARWVIAVASLLAMPPAVQAADTTPPTTPVVTDDGAYTSSATQLHASWTSSEPESRISEYQYLIRQDSTSGPIIVNWTSTNTVPSVTKTGLTLLQGKTYYFGVKAKNNARLWSNIGYSDGIKVDTTPPSPVATVTDDGATTTSTTQLHVTWTPTSDPESGIKSYYISMKWVAPNGSFCFCSSGSADGSATEGHVSYVLLPGYTYYMGVSARNGANLPSSERWTNGILAVGGDTTPPSGTIKINGVAAYTGSTTVTLTLSATDDLGIVAQMQFSNDNVTYSTLEPYATTKAWTLSSGDGTKTAYVKFKDTAGNTSTATSDTITLDTTAPTAPTVTDDGAYTNSASQLHASWTASSDAGSGIANYQYQVRRDSTIGAIIRDWTSVGVVTDVTATGFGLTSGSTYFIGLRAVNGAGLTSSAGFSDGITVDVTPPTGTVSINSGAANTNSPIVTLSLVATDNIGPITQMQFSNDNATYAAPEAYATTKTWTLSSGDGTKTVYVKFKDQIGNWSLAATDTILLDTTPPLTTANPAGGTFMGALSVSLTASEAATIRYTINGTTPTTSSLVYTSAIPISATTTLKFFAVDSLGNTEFVKTEIYQIQSSPTATDVSGTISVNTTWTPSGSPYRLVGNLTVASGVTLTIQAGTVVWAQGNYSLTVQGTLQANGTSSQPISFLSGQGVPAPGQWTGLAFTGTGTGSLTQVQIRHATYGLNLTGTGTVSLTNSTLEQCSQSAVTIQNGILNVIGSTLRNDAGSYALHIGPGADGVTVNGNSRIEVPRASALGIYLYYGINPALVSVTNSQLLVAGSYSSAVSIYCISGVYACSAPTPNYTGQPVNFTSNWWGTSDPVAIGAQISDYADGAAYGSAPLIDFTPFLDGPSGSPVPGNFVWGPISANTTWSAANSPYLMVEDLTVLPGATLTLNAGVTVQVKGNYTVSVQGTLQANGTSSQPISFLSGQGVPAPGQWTGLAFTGTGTGSLTQVQLQHASYGLNLSGTGTVSLQGSAVSQCSNATVYVQDGVFNATNSTLRNDAGSYALYIGSGADGVTVNGNSHIEVSGVGNYGVYLYYGLNPALLSVTNSQLLATNSNTRVVSIYCNYGTYACSAPNPNYTGQPVNFTNNWWGTSDPVAISGKIDDYADGAAFGSAQLIDFTPFLDGHNGNPVPGNFVWGPLLANTTWTAANNPYLMVEDVVVKPGVTLTLDPGVLVQVKSNYTVSVQGTLQATGTAASPISFLSGQGVPAPGQWTGLYFSGAGGGTLTQVVVQHAQYGIQLSGTGTVNLQGSTVSQCSNSAAYVSSGTLTVTGSTLRADAGTNSKVLYVTSTTPTVTITGSRLEATTNNYVVYLQLISPTKLTITNSQLLAASLTNRTVYIDNCPGYYCYQPSPDYTGQPVNFTNNWWGTSDPVAISSLIYDYADGSAYAPKISFDPFLDGPNGTPRFGIYLRNIPAISFLPVQESLTLDLFSLQPATWSATFRNGQGTAVRTIMGSLSTDFLMTWNGTGQDGVTPVSKGSYTYTIDATNTTSGLTAIPKLGNVFVSDSSGSPTAEITSPIANQAVGGASLAILGIAEAGGQFDRYDLYWGEGAAPVSWTYIAGKTTPVLNATLGTLSLTNMTQGTITLRLRSYNKTGALSTAQVTITIMNLYNVAASNTFISPNADGIQDTTTVTASITQSANWTVGFKPSLAAAAVRTFSGTSTAVSAVWDGKDALGNFVAEGTYVVHISATEPTASLTDEDTTKTITVDRTIPTAAITAPTENQAFLRDDPLVFTGTADDANFLNYTLAYGAGTNPSSFTTLITSLAKVLNGTLYTLDVRTLAPNTYTFRLTVTDRAGTPSIVNRHVTLDHIGISAISATPTFIDPYSGDASTISYTISQKATVTTQIYDNLSKQLVRTFTEVLKSGGKKTVLWDGKNAAGAIAPLEAYFFTIVATDIAGRQGTYNNSTTPLLGPTPSYSPSVNATNFNPYRNDLVSISYTLNTPGRVTITILDSPYAFGSVLRTLVNQGIRAAGPLTEYWDGRRDDGSMFQGSFGVLAGAGVSLPLNPIVLSRAPIEFTNFRAEAYLIQPVFGEVSRMTYTLSRNANVTITLTDPNGNLVRTLLSSVAQTAGSQSLEWNGLTDSGKVVSVEGDYTVTLTGVDSITGLSYKRLGSVVVYK